MELIYKDEKVQKQCTSLKDAKKPFDPCNIDEIANIVEIVEIREVSNHYE